MDKEAINDLISQDKLMDAVELCISGSTSRRRTKTLKLLKGRLVSLEDEDNQGVLDSKDYAIRKNRIRKDIIELIDFDFKDQLPVELISDTLQERKIRFELKKITFTHQEEHKKFLAELARKYRWGTIIAAEIHPEDIQVGFHELARELIITIDKISLSPNLTIVDQSSETIEDGTKLWSEKSARDGMFWQEINHLTKLKINDKIENDNLLRQKILNKSKELIFEHIADVVSGDDIGDNKIVIRIKNIEAFDGYAIEVG